MKKTLTETEISTLHELAKIIAALSGNKFLERDKSPDFLCVKQIYMKIADFSNPENNHAELLNKNLLRILKTNPEIRDGLIRTTKLLTENSDVLSSIIQDCISTSRGKNLFPSLPDKHITLQELKYPSEEIFRS